MPGAVRAATEELARFIVGSLPLCSPRGPCRVASPVQDTPVGACGAASIVLVPVAVAEHVASLSLRWIVANERVVAPRV